MNDEVAGRATARGAKILALLIALSLLWNLLADRYTPYTSQARVQGYVVGVAPQVSGTLTQVWVANNQEVDEGQRLFEVDPTPYRIALARAQSELEKIRRQVEAGDAGVESARASLAAAEANELRARQDFERLTRLRERDPGTISLRRLETSQAALDQAIASTARAQSEIQRAIEQKGGDIEAENANLLAAQSAVEKAEFDLANTVVRAPSRGLITDLSADVGAYAGTGGAVMTLIAIHDLWINAAFTENNLGHIAAGSEAELIFDALPGRVYDGRVRSVGTGVSAGRNTQPGNLPQVNNDRDWLRQAQRFPVEIGFDIEQAPELQQQLRLGGQVSVMVYSDDSTVLRWIGIVYLRFLSYLSYAY
jgi:multidrug resistance efflux pump